MVLDGTPFPSTDPPSRKCQSWGRCLRKDWSESFPSVIFNWFWTLTNPQNHLLARSQHCVPGLCTHTEAPQSFRSTVPLITHCASINGVDDLIPCFFPEKVESQQHCPFPLTRTSIRRTSTEDGVVVEKKGIDDYRLWITRPLSLSQPPALWDLTWRLAKLCQSHGECLAKEASHTSVLQMLFYAVTASTHGWGVADYLFNYVKLCFICFIM